MKEQLPEGGVGRVGETLFESRLTGPGDPLTQVRKSPQRRLLVPPGSFDGPAEQIRRDVEVDSHVLHPRLR